MKSESDKPNLDPKQDPDSVPSPERPPDVPPEIALRRTLESSQSMYLNEQSHYADSLATLDSEGLVDDVLGIEGAYSIDLLEEAGKVDVIGVKKLPPSPSPKSSNTVAIALLGGIGLVVIFLAQVFLSNGGSQSAALIPGPTSTPTIVAQANLPVAPQAPAAIPNQPQQQSGLPPGPCVPAPIVFDPPDGKSFSAKSTVFRWRSDYNLQTDEVFGVMVGISEKNLMKIGSTRDKTLDVDLTKWNFVGTFGKFLWLVRVEKSSGAVISCASQPFAFVLNPAAEPQAPAAQPQQPAAPTPKPTGKP